MERKNKPSQQEVRNRILSPAERFWEESIAPIQFYHGTSEALLSSIQRNGITPFQKPYQSEDLVTIAHIGYERTGYKYTYLHSLAQSQASYVGTDLYRCLEYATSGSEVIGEALTMIDHIVTAGEFQNGVQDEISDLLRIRQQFVDFFGRHRPMLVMINRNSQSLREVLTRDIPQTYAALLDKQTFVHAAIAVAEEEGVDEEGGARIIEEQISHALTDVPIDRPIPPDDLTFVTGDTFYTFSRELVIRKKTIDTLLFDFDRQPPIVISVLTGIMNGRIEDIQILKRVCSSYGISQEDTEILYQRVREIVNSN